MQGIRTIRPTFFGISTLLPGTIEIPTLLKKVAFQCFNRHQKPNIRCRRDKIIFVMSVSIIHFGAAKMLYSSTLEKVFSFVGSS